MKSRYLEIYAGGLRKLSTWELREMVKEYSMFSIGFERAKRNLIIAEVRARKQPA